MSETAPSSSLHRWIFVGLALLAMLAIAVEAFRVKSGDDPTQPVDLATVLQPGAATGFNLLLITMDTTRPDRLGCYGYEQARTPNIDALLEHGVRFDDAVTSAPLTLPSHASMMTGRYPPSIGVRDNGRYQLPDRYQTMAESLKATGYQTAAFVSCFVLDARFGLDQGFDIYDFQISHQRSTGAVSLEHERRASEVTQAASRWLKQNAEHPSPFYMWVHYFDPHWPYDSPLAEPTDSISKAYDEEIAFTDHHLGLLLGMLDELHQRERTVIVFVTDHGESLMQHEELTHGYFVYDTTMRAALILSCPVLFDRSYRVDDRIVGTVDLVPTLWDLLGIDSETGFDGISLIKADAPADRAVYIETFFPRAGMGCSELIGLRRHQDKFIRAPRPEYYDLKADPHEQQNLYLEASAPVDELERRLTEMEKRWTNDGSAHEGQTELDAKDLAILASLGYVQGSSPEGDLPDPKDRIALVNRFNRISMIEAAGRPEEAVKELRELATQTSGWDAPVIKAAELLTKLDRHDEAVTLLEQFANEHLNADVLYYLAQTLMMQKRYDACLEKLKAAEAADDTGLGAILMLRGDVYMKQGKYDLAAAEYERALRIDGERLGSDILTRLAEARANLRSATP